jgi:hypothetical protein
VLLIENRQDTLEGCRRKKRHYTKSNTTYWESGIKEKGAKQ